VGLAIAVGGLAFCSCVLWAVTYVVTLK
jgi:hypothetical protein